MGRLGHTLSTLRPVGRPTGRKTRFRLLARLYRVGSRPTGFLRKVSSMLLTSLSPFPRLSLAQARVGPPQPTPVELQGRFLSDPVAPARNAWRWCRAVIADRIRAGCCPGACEGMVLLSRKPRVQCSGPEADSRMGPQPVLCRMLGAGTLLLIELWWPRPL